ncbi:hypothetical protein GW17_00038972 [Ensete ventricosum]|nr:hypothetical protein GW17_00038972 [Ensete ventricosum]
MASEGMFVVSLASVVEDVLKQHGTKLSDVNLASRKAGEAGERLLLCFSLYPFSVFDLEFTLARRYEAAGWLRKAVGVVAAKDLPDEPSEEEFRLGLRNGLILCNALNKIHPGAVPKVVVNPGDTVQQPDGAALSAYQYFENVRNFLVAVQEIGLPTFEASDLEQGGKSARIVNCVLALKSYGEWKQMGGHGSFRYGGNSKPSISGKSFVRKNSDDYKCSLSRSQSLNENDGLCTELNSQGDVSMESCQMIIAVVCTLQELRHTLQTTKAGMEFMHVKFTDEFAKLDSSSRMNLPVRDDKEIVSGDWVDKIMVNKLDTAVMDDNPMIDWEGDSGTLPDFFYQRCVSDMRIYPDKQCHKSAMRRKDSYELDMQRSHSYYVATDDSDDQDIATSDSSEADMLWQFSLQNVHITGNESGSRIKKPQPKFTQSSDISLSLLTRVAVSLSRIYE